jgi:acyl-CoA synthetase (NDP forming)/GNAT superfamily N-acetyltransferase
MSNKASAREGRGGEWAASGRPASAYALLADGTAVEIRSARPGDFSLVKSMHAAMSPDNEYRRFFSLSKLSAEREAERVCRMPAPDHAALLALKGGELVGVGTYEIAGQDTAEIALAVADDMHGRGVGTLLLEHLGSAARRHGVRTFTGPVLPENAEMLRVFADAGLSVHRHVGQGVIDLACDLPQADSDPYWEPYHEAVARREVRADVASLRHVFLPDSVAIVGAGRRAGTVGRAILHNVVTGGYQGNVYAVNPHATRMEGVSCLPSVSKLPEPVDLAVIAVPPRAVITVADECGRRGVKALVVVTAGLDAFQGADLLATCRRYGMRLIGPNCLGIAVPGIGLDATFAARHPAPGVVGLVMQSGGPGFALVDRLSRLGLGISSFASLGSKYDVSGDDLLMWWDQDDTTRIALLYIESFGNPRKFARVARLVGYRMPVLAVRAGKSSAGPQAAAFRTAAAPISREALFKQAGIIATDSLGELVDAAALLASQPVPAGRRVAVVSNLDEAGVLAANACADAGLVVHRLSPDTRRRLRGLVPPGGTLIGPVNTTVAVTETSFRRCLELVAADAGVDAILALVLPTAATGDLISSLRAANIRCPLAAVVLDQAEAVRLLPAAGDGARGGTAGQAGCIPAYADYGTAARALARAATYGVWRARPPGHLPEFSDVKEDDARELVRAFLARSPHGGWLAPQEVTELLACYSIPLTGPASATGAGDTPSGADRPASAEVTIGVTQEPVFGPLILFGPGDDPTSAASGQTARLAPLTETDAEELVRSVRSTGRLASGNGAPPADLAALQEILLRVSRLADDVPEVAELDLRPVSADGVPVRAARIRLAPAQPHDAALRKLL